MEIMELFHPLYLAEASRNIPIIVVDVQPAYERWIKPKFHPSDLAYILNQHSAPILMFVNADEQGMTEDTQSSVAEWWFDHGLEPSLWNSGHFTYYDKGYGFFRDWMDEGVSPRAIIQALRFMYQAGETDSREFFYYQGDYDPEVGEAFKAAVGPEWDDWMEDAGLFTNWVGVDLLHRHRGYICGGGRNECLREVTLLMNAFNLKYKLMERFVYG